MKPILRFPALVLPLVVCACASNPQRLPVAVPVCKALADPGGGFHIIANVENRSDRPISRLDLSSAFYQDFRYQRYTASANLRQELDPGQRRDIRFDTGSSGPVRPQGQAIRCFVTHIGYLDGTSQDAPPSQ